MNYKAVSTQLLHLVFALLPGLLPGQVAHIAFDSERQLIRGFGGVNMPAWIGDMTPEQVDTAFGRGEGQLGFSILRIRVPTDPSDWARELPSAIKAKQMGATIIASPWSPPPHMKTNQNIVGGELLPEFYGAYARHLADFTNFMAAHGAELFAISIQNEPDIQVEYESCDWTPAQVSTFLKHHASVIPTRIIASESFRFDRAQTDPILTDPEASATVDIIGGHIYGSGLYPYPLAALKGKEVWMTEHLVLDTDWPNVLGTGREIHDCMVSDFNAYLWWYIRRFYGPLAEDGSVSKRGYVMSHFSRFVRPGFVRVQANPSPTPGVSVSAFRDLRTAAIVMINQSPQEKPLTINLSGARISSMQRFETNAAQNLASLTPPPDGTHEFALTLPAGSITTLTGSLTPATSFTNPVLPGDHPDPVILKHGDNFYLTHSNSGRIPIATILHSTDLMHWQPVANVVPAALTASIPEAAHGGNWQGVITHFHGSFWYYLTHTDGQGQYVFKAPDPRGPWSRPETLRGPSFSGLSGIDLSVFIDDDGTPFMLIRGPGNLNRIQGIGPDGHLTGKIIDLGWMVRNSHRGDRASPVMSKREGTYYYFVEPDPNTAPQVYRTRSLTASPRNWQYMGSLFDPQGNPTTRFNSPRHISAPMMLPDGTWWILSHSLERPPDRNLSSLGRQGLLHQITWDSQGKPSAATPIPTPVPGPALMNLGVQKRGVCSDLFEKQDLALDWHFLDPDASTRYSLAEHPGWLRLKPDNSCTHLLQRECSHSYSLITHLSLKPNSKGQKAGIVLTSPDEALKIEVYSGFNEGRILGANIFGHIHEVPNPFGNQVWLKIERNGTLINGFYSTNGRSWDLLIRDIDATPLDNRNLDSGCCGGTSIGLFAEGLDSDFEHFIHLQ